MTKFYAVKSGRNQGIFHSWSECEKQVKGFRGAKYKSFTSLEDAEKFIGAKTKEYISESGIQEKETSTSKKSKYYAVSIGKTPGIYRSWKECQEQTTGISKALYKSFSNETEAMDFMTMYTSKKRKMESIQSSENAAMDLGLDINLSFDGGSRGNPGLSGAGAYLIIKQNTIEGSQNKKEIKISHYCGVNHTNNFAEYTGLVEGLKHALLEIESFCKSNPKNASINFIVEGDSMLVINQMNGAWKVKDDTIQLKNTECKNLISRMKTLFYDLNGSTSFTVTFRHIYRNKNSIADDLANQAMDKRSSHTAIL